jgi:hypothetical protein
VEEGLISKTMEYKKMQTMNSLFSMAIRCMSLIIKEVGKGSNFLNTLNLETEGIEMEQ